MNVFQPMPSAVTWAGFQVIAFLFVVALPTGTDRMREAVKAATVRMNALAAVRLRS
jgi:hypothetical protein